MYHLWYFRRSAAEKKGPLKNKNRRKIFTGGKGYAVRGLLFISIILGGFFAFRYFSLLYAMKKTEEEIREIQQDLTQNQMLHLPVPSPA